MNVQVLSYRTEYSINLVLELLEWLVGWLRDKTKFLYLGLVSICKYPKLVGFELLWVFFTPWLVAKSGRFFSHKTLAPKTICNSFFLGTRSAGWRCEYGRGSPFGITTTDANNLLGYIVEEEKLGHMTHDMLLHEHMIWITEIEPMYDGCHMAYKWTLPCKVIFPIHENLVGFNYMCKFFIWKKINSIMWSNVRQGIIMDINLVENYCVYYFYLDTI